MATEAIIASAAQPASSPAAAMPSAAYRDYLRGLRRRALTIQAWQIGLVAFILIVWEVAPRAGWINPMLTSHPSAVMATLVSALQDGSLALHSWTTFSEIVIGSCGGMAIGLACAVALWSSPFLYRVLDPFIVVLNGMPKIALVPIFYIWLGDTASIYAMAIAVSVFVTIIMLYTGFNAVDPDKIKLAKLFGASQRQILLKIVRFPPACANDDLNLKVNVGLGTGRRRRRRVSGRKGRSRIFDHLRKPDFPNNLVMTSIVVLAAISPCCSSRFRPLR